MTAARQHLSQLESSGLVRVAQVQPELEYLFRHALVHEAAYESLLRQDRKRLHLAVGEMLERLYPQRLDELAPLLGQHFDEAGDDERALKYQSVAGDLAYVRYANAEAVAHYTRALQIARRGAVAGEQLIHLYSRRGRALEMTGAYDEALANYEEMQSLGRERGDRPMELAALVARGTVYSAPTAVHDAEQGHVLSGQALTLARELRDRQSEAKVLWNLLLLSRFAGDTSKALHYGERSLALARELNMREQIAHTLNDMTAAYTLDGQLDKALQILEEAQQLWRELGHLPMLVDSLASSAFTHLLVGKGKQAIALSQEAEQISRAIGNIWGQSYSLFSAAYAYVDQGRMGRAIEIMEECIRLAKLAGFAVPLVQTRSDLAFVYGILGDADRGLELARLAGHEAERLSIPYLRHWYLAALARLYLLKGDVAQARPPIHEIHSGLQGKPTQPIERAQIALAEGELALAEGDYERAFAVCEAAIPAIRQFSLRLFAPEFLYLKAKALLGQGHTHDAKEALETARAETESVGSRRMLWQILAALGDIESESGSPTQAERLRREAKAIVRYIADHIGRPELRTSFLNLPDVRAVLRAKVGDRP